MKLSLLGKLTGVLLLTASLTACIDATVDVNVTSETNAKVTMTQEMGAEFYSMIKQGAAAGQTTQDAEFCADGELTENADGGATCINMEEGPFADLTMGEDEENVVFTSAGPGLVRVSLPTEEMKGEIGADEAIDEQTKAMMTGLFEGHAITVRFSGGEIVETNMTLAGDKKSAEQVIPFMDLINGDVDLPDELYAVVKVN